MEAINIIIQLMMNWVVSVVNLRVSETFIFS